MTLTINFQNSEILEQDDINKLIQYLINPEIEDHSKLEVLKSFSDRHIHQKELTYIAQSLIKTMYPTQPTYEGSLCVCGTGGDGSNSFNISTTVALIVSSAGVPVIKHGNKSVTSNSGSTDLLEALRIKTTKVADVVEEVKNKGIAFVSSTESYPVMKHIQPVRKMIGQPTFLNLMGPLIHPFALNYQVMGVYDVSKLEDIIHTLKDLGRKRAIVLHGAGGMDEATLSGDNFIYELNNGKVSHYILNAQDLGFKYAPNESLVGGTPEENKDITLNIL